jgi:hypothetical protein
MPYWKCSQTRGVTVTERQAQQLERDANSDRTWQRDHADEIWQQEYERLFPRPANAVNVTQPGA